MEFQDTTTPRHQFVQQLQLSLGSCAYADRHSYTTNSMGTHTCAACMNLHQAPLMHRVYKVPCSDTSNKSSRYFI